MSSIADALSALLEPLNVGFGDATKPKTATTRYIVAWFDAGLVSDSSLKARDGRSQVGTFHCYGRTPEAARFAYDALTEAILSLRGATVGSRILLLPEQLTALPMQRDDNLSPPLFDAVCEWRFPTSHA